MKKEHDLTDIVERVAQMQYDRVVRASGNNPGPQEKTWPTWASLPAAPKVELKDSLLPVIMAVLDIVDEDK